MTIHDIGTCSNVKKTPGMILLRDVGCCAVCDLEPEGTWTGPQTYVT